MNSVLFVTGCSAAGKTTLGRALAQRSKVALWTDLDEHANERPQTAWLDWLRWRAAEALRAAPEVENLSSPDHSGHGLVVVTGIVWPFRVIESPAWEQVAGSLAAVGWLMLDPPWRVVKERLEHRLADKPRAEQRELLRYNRELRRPLRYQVEAVRRGHVLDGTDDASMVAAVLDAYEDGWL